MREAFEKALTDDVYDELTHRAYADWLYENGHDQEAEYHVLWTKEWQEAKDELEKIANSVVGISTNELIAEYSRYLDYLADGSATIDFTHIALAIYDVTVLDKLNKYYHIYMRKEKPEVPKILEPEEPVQPYTCCCVEDSEDQCCY